MEGKRILNLMYVSSIASRQRKGEDRDWGKRKRSPGHITRNLSSSETMHYYAGQQGFDFDDREKTPAYIVQHINEGYHIHIVS
jgi:hypothetical protein